MTSRRHHHDIAATPNRDTRDLVWQGDDGVAPRQTADAAVEEVAAGGQDRGVCAEVLVARRHGDIAQCVPPPLLVQTAQDVGGVHGRLEGEP